jgi:alpha-beta hydrolase superfamily lysophospholipase
LLNGTKNQIQINSALSTSTALLFNPTFYNNLLNPSGELVLKAQVAANSFPNLYPKSPTRLYHGTADEDVPFQTSQSTYTRFKAAGSTSLTLTSIPNGTHETSVQPMFLDVLPWIQSMQ